MRTVTRTAAQLAAGDIFTHHGERAVVLHTIDHGASGVAVYAAVLNRQPSVLPAQPVGATPWDAKFAVEVPDTAPLTPAQSHAEDLVEVLAYFLPQIERQVSEDLSGGGAGAGMDEVLRLSHKARKLITEVILPKPPTLAEALALLGDIERDQWTAAGERHKCVQAARALLDRAKKTGLL